MTTYPVRYTLESPARFRRLTLFIRLVAFCALGVLGVQVGSVFWLGFLALPVVAAMRGIRDRERIISALRWFGAVNAWAGLCVEDVPDPTVRLEIDGATQPTGRSAIVRIFTGLPSALVLGLLTCIGGLVWLWAALSILLHERVGRGALDYLTGLQRWSVRLLAYQASLVDEYPPFSFTDASPAQSALPSQARDLL